MKNNFKCDCGKTFFVHQFSYVSGKFFDRHRKELKCECGLSLKHIPKTKIPIALNIGKFEGLPVHEKSAILKKRSKEHFNKEIKEQKIFKDK